MTPNTETTPLRPPPARELVSFGPPLRLRAGPAWVVRRLRTPLARINPRPVIVLGNQKAGTSAIAGLLGAAADASVTLDLRNEQTAHPLFIRCRLGRLPFAELVRRNKLDFSRDIVKEPNLSLLYDQLVDYFPASPVILIVRDPRDNIRALLNWMRLPGSLASVDESDLTHLTTVQRSVLRSEWLGAAPGNYVESLAHRWNLIADISLRHPRRVELVRYEDFCADKTGAIGRTAAAVGLRASKDIHDQLDRQFQPRGDRSVSWSGFFEENLDRIMALCGGRMGRLGYGAVT
ncbi:MAG TPA: sulfotransferase domain-containing protein [Gaiellales bacterium]|nr:sulfotransferase domain-containing protein [Gaiellales bacterium]